MEAVVNRRFLNVALPICLAAMDACWLYIAARLIRDDVLISGGYFTFPSALMLAALQAAAWALGSYLIANRGLPLPSAQLLLGAVGLLAAFGTTLLVNFPAHGFSVGWAGSSLYSIIIALIPWGIGSFRASSHPDFNQVYGAFRTGLAIIGVSALLVTILSGGNANAVWAGTGATAVWFFGWSLAGLALGNRELVREESGSQFSGSWGLVLVASIAAVLLIGLVGGAIGGWSLLTVFQVILGWIVYLASSLFYLFFYVFYQLASLINIQLPRFGPPKPVQTQQATDPTDQLRKQYEKAGEPGAISIPPEVQAVFFGLLTLIVIVAVVYITGKLLRSRVEQRELHADEEHEDLGGWDLLVSQFKGWLERLLLRFRKTPPVPATQAVAEDDLAALRDRPELSSTLTVRQIYARLLGLAARAGYPRARQQTPAEYFSVLSRALPQIRLHLRDITSAYIEARYGPQPASGPAVLTANNAWKFAEPALQAAADEREQNNQVRSQRAHSAR